MIRMKEISMPISIPDKDPILAQIYEEAAYYYYEQLMHSDNIGRRYLLKRGITKANMAEYGLGYAPDAFANLYNMMRRQYPQEDLMRSGLFKISQNGNPYDFFRNRLWRQGNGRFKTKVHQFTGKHIIQQEKLFVWISIRFSE